MYQPQDEEKPQKHHAAHQEEHKVKDLAIKEATLTDNKSASTSIFNQSPSFSCSNYRGILHIRKGDPFAAAGTLFFVYVLNHLLYAEIHNLLPWIHFEPEGVCYDPLVHNSANSHDGTVTATIYENVTLGSALAVNDCGISAAKKKRIQKSYPGNITIPTKKSSSSLTVYGNGIWNSYFEPVNPLPACPHLPIIQLPNSLITPGLHRCAPWSVRPWAMTGLPQHLSPTIDNGDGSNTDATAKWLANMRNKAHRLVKQYYQPLPWFRDTLSIGGFTSNDKNAQDHSSVSSNECGLGLHIRWTDKGHGRTKLPLSEFLPYAETFVEATNSRESTSTNSAGIRNTMIYLATDDERVWNEVVNTWPSSLLDSNRIIYRTSFLRSSLQEPVFDRYADQHHRTNTEALIDIYTLSSCRFLVHGYSAMSEAALYLNGNDNTASRQRKALHGETNNSGTFSMMPRTRKVISINLDLPTHERISVAQFQTILLDEVQS
eukprot:CAMPEP_0178927542 /NCGR_PEP_ID=MMETSP0786-20121207/19258_1 /TAXON_ID=186022 /ORGANISM="Thalassionema frauenfeldii, Strain CCMP 1798" /LENGTH=488 /DNA_ID=CAMNT_0020603011 /DNA_START=313 /DNA_END=1779 /DNA_ORIENTATION=+